MASDKGWLPDIVVGIDVGFASTGVAYSAGPGWGEPKILQHWPGKMVEPADKVPTRLQYTEDHRKVKAWGFLCDQESEDINLEYFKLHLDPGHTVPGLYAQDTLEEARKGFQDFLRCLYDHIDQCFSGSFLHWNTLQTEFIFSVPALWQSPSTIATLESLIKGAGYGGINHRARIGLTEAEATAVYACRQRFEEDDVILVCDAGGGTTDVHGLQLMSSRGERTILRPLSWVTGRAIGSLMIDFDFTNIVSDRLEKIREHLQRKPIDTARRMMTDGRFEQFKCYYGTPSSSKMLPLALKVPGLKPGLHFLNAANIEDSVMIIDGNDLKKLLDDQIDNMLNLINSALDVLESRHPRKQVSYLVLSGGLGSSRYVKQQLKSYYETGEGSARPNAQEAKIVVVAEPQLAVVYGLVMDRVQAIVHGGTGFKKRCCRVSYGVRCRKEYQPHKNAHVGQKVFMDPRDGKLYVKDQIDWLIKQGDDVPSNGISKRFSLNIKPGEEYQPWKTSIVISYEPREQLPTSMYQDGVWILCALESVLKDEVMDMKLKNRHWYNTGETFLHVRFFLRVILGPADIKFQIQSEDEIVRDHDFGVIQISWDPAISFDPLIVSDTTHAASSKSLTLEAPVSRSISTELSLRSSVRTASSATRDTNSSRMGSFDTADSVYHEPEMIQDQMAQVSQEMKHVLPPDGLYTHSITLLIHGDFQRYFKKELRTGQTLGQTLTLSGNVEKAYAAPCAQYVQWLWPETGLWVLEVMEGVVDKGRLECSLLPSSPNEVSVNAQIQRDGDLLMVTASGLMETLISISQQLVWLTAVMRVHHFVSLTFANLRLRHLESATFEIVSDGSRQLYDGTTQCWYPLFKNSSLALGFPIPERDREKGLELSFDVMLHLASITYAVTYNGGTVLSGFSTILFPTGHYQFEDCHSIQWHFVESEVEHTPIDAGAKLAKFDDQWIKINDINVFRSARNFLGHCSHARVYLGSENSDFEKITASGLPDDRPSPEISVLSGSFGSAGTGILGGSINIDVRLPSGMARVTKIDHYNDILRAAKNMPIILYNSERQQGWLVSTLSVILHMAHAWIKENVPNIQLGYAEPLWDGGKAAFDLIVSKSQMELESAYDGGKPRLLKDVIQRLWEQVISCYNATDLDNKRLTKSRGTLKTGPPKLRGWEYSEILDPPPGVSRMKQHELREREFGWNALNDDVLLLVCKGLSDAIKPANLNSCREFYRQHGENYLVASLACLQQMSKRRGFGVSCSKLTDHAFWHPPQRLFDECTHGLQEPCPKPLQALVEQQSAKPRPKLPEQGAVIFGYKRGKLKKNVPAANVQVSRT